MYIGNMFVHNILIGKLFQAILTGINKSIWKMNAFDVSHDVWLLGVRFLANCTEVAFFASVVVDILLQDFRGIT